MKKIRRLLKMKWFRILLGIALFLFLLDFIPVKFAKKDAYVTIDNQKYVFCYEPKTGYEPEFVNWSTDDYLHYVKIKGKNPYDYFTEKDFDPIMLVNSPYSDGNNKFVFYGEMQEFWDDENGSTVAVDIEGWDIVYPINRLSFRKNYVPKSYLTIYDFNWKEVLKTFLGR